MSYSVELVREKEKRSEDMSRIVTILMVAVLILILLLSTTSVLVTLLPYFYPRSLSPLLVLAQIQLKVKTHFQEN